MSDVARLKRCYLGGVSYTIAIEAPSLFDGGFMFLTNSLVLLEAFPLYKMLCAHENVSMSLMCIPLFVCWFTRY